jgi:GH43 family beta-xylosidase
MKVSEIQIRDPFVLHVLDEGAYYLFGSTDPNIWSGPGVRFDCYRSIDLLKWVGRIAAFRPPAGFWWPGSFWAPEVHRVGDGWFMFATFTGVDGHPWDPGTPRVAP